MKNLLIGIVLSSIAFVGVASAQTVVAKIKATGIVLTNVSDDGRINKYYDYDNGVVCYTDATPVGYARAISCLK
jgi:hypothetical protein